MTRPVSADMADAIKSGSDIALIAQIEHPDGTLYVWTGVGTLEYNGQSYVGAGKLGQVSPVRNTTDLAIQEIVFSMRGVNPTDAARLSGNVRNLRAQVWMVALDYRGQVIADPYQVIDAIEDFQTLEVQDDGMTSLNIITRNGFYTLERALQENWTAEDQKQIYPTDSGLDMIASLVNQDIQWNIVGH